jgi:hypothetical protein
MTPAAVCAENGSRVTWPAAKQVQAPDTTGMSEERELTPDYSSSPPAAI